MEDKMIPFDLELVKKGYKVVTRDGRPVLVYDYRGEGNFLIEAVINPFSSNSNHGCFTLTGKYAVNGETDLDLFCIDPEADKKEETIIPFDVEAAKAGAPFDFIEPQNKGTIKRVLAWNFVVQHKGQLLDAMVFTSKLDNGSELLQIMSLTNDPTDLYNAHLQLKMLPKPKEFAALYKLVKNINVKTKDGKGGYTKRVDYYIDECLYHAPDKNLLPEHCVEDEFVGFFPVEI